MTPAASDAAATRPNHVLVPRRIKSPTRGFSIEARGRAGNFLAVWRPPRPPLGRRAPTPTSRQATAAVPLHAWPQRAPARGPRGAGGGGQPQPISTRQVAPQPSPAAVLPSSHSSPHAPSTLPSPQRG